MRTRKTHSILGKTLFVFNVLFALSLFLATLSQMVSPEKSTLIFVLGMGYPFLLVINLVFVIYYIFKRRLSFLLSLAVIVFGYQNLGSLMALHAGDIDIGSSNEFSVMSFNVRAMNRYGWIDRPNVNQEIMDFVKEQQTDILLFQEFLDKPLKFTNIRGIKKENFRYSYHEKRGANYSTANELFGLIIFSKYRIVGKGVVYFDAIKKKAKAIYADIKIKGSILRVYNIHLNSMGMVEHDYEFVRDLGNQDNDVTIEKSKSLLKKLTDAAIQRSYEVTIIKEHIANSPYPVVVGGDFNEPSYTYAYPNIRGNLRDAFLEDGSGLGLTYKGIVNMPSLRIDYLLYSDAIVSQKFHLYNVKLSDHLPIQADFTFAE